MFAVRGEGVSKLYRLGATMHGRLTESVADAMMAPVRRFRRDGGRRAAPEAIWALKDVDFEAEEGEVVGFIGRNGAGKSTLLKILSRITEPTEGFVELRGRVGSLLEVGSGFHPDLTGHENTYLYGALLGMRRREVARRFDEIVAFADVERFIDTPVKRYSSGMYMRLAFAVAAHLEPEILIVDEVLSVGDATFQKRSLQKMEEVATSGSTVLFVSHNLPLVATMCDRAYLLEQGRVVESGAAPDVVERLIESNRAAETIALGDRTDRRGDATVKLTGLRIENADVSAPIGSSSRLRITLDYESSSVLRAPQFQVTVHDANHSGIFRLDSDSEGGLPPTLPARGAVSCVTESISLTPGRCGLNVSVSQQGVVADHIEYAGSFDVLPDDFYRSGKLPPRSSVVALRRHHWTLDPASAGVDENLALPGERV